MARHIENNSFIIDPDNDKLYFNGNSTSEDITKKIKSLAEEVVETTADLPAPDGTDSYIILENKQYKILGDFYCPYQLRPPATGSCGFIPEGKALSRILFTNSTTGKHGFGGSIGSGGFFAFSDGIVVASGIAPGSGHKLFDGLAGNTDGRLFIDNGILAGFDYFGDINNLDLSIIASVIQQFRYGLVITNGNQVTIRNNTISKWQDPDLSPGPNITTTLFEVNGCTLYDIKDNKLQDGNLVNTTLYTNYIHGTISAQVTNNFIQRSAYFWNPSSKKEDDVDVLVKDNTAADGSIKDSDVSIAAVLLNNTATTTTRYEDTWQFMDMDATWTKLKGQRINIDTSDGTLTSTSLQEVDKKAITTATVETQGTNKEVSLISMQMKVTDYEVTFDNTTERVNLVSATAPQNGELVTFYFSAGTTPALVYKPVCYIVGDRVEAPASFRLYSKLGAPALVSFADDGSGTNTFKIVEPQLLEQTEKISSSTRKQYTLHYDPVIQTGCKNKVAYKDLVLTQSNLTLYQMKKSI
jgi:hypothetical protein